ncbi:hypothetical protein JOM49_008159 [Amycolatopsis magusensis]|uniref:Uncharacterized protein n=1 Tax=Amycolatopsis magusensis TaxID=882444 RepID=A0ABS4Q4M5_9PSEU|nr:hypothetical protein [Amycolatopsis magusensis]
MKIPRTRPNPLGLDTNVALGADSAPKATFVTRTGATERGSLPRRPTPEGLGATGAP